MTHPARQMIESLHAKAACPRLQVDATRDGIVCPDFLREQWKERLVIDLDPSWPLNLAFTEDCVEADLAFDGFVARCVFPFSAIYMVADRETGKGVVIDANMPESVRAERRSTPRPKTQADARAAGKSGRVAGESRRRRRKRAEPEAAAPIGVVPEPPAKLEPTKAPAQAKAPIESVEPAADAEARRRRSGFSVIDGDG